MSVTKAITIDQPYATLIAEQIKTWETRPMPFNGLQPAGVRGLPGCRVEPGERIAIHASARPVPAGEHATGFNAYPRFGGDSQILAKRGRSAMAMRFGAIVATAVVGRALPIHDPDKLPDVGLAYEWQPHITAGRFTLVEWVGRTSRVTGNEKWSVRNIDTQRPYGHWVDGNWAMELLDVQRLAEPVPCKGFQGVWRLERAGVTL